MEHGLRQRCDKLRQLDKEEAVTITRTSDAPMTARTSALIDVLDVIRRDAGDAEAQEAVFDILGGLLRWVIDNRGEQAARSVLWQALDVLDASVKLASVEMDEPRPN